MTTPGSQEPQNNLLGSALPPLEEIRAQQAMDRMTQDYLAHQVVDLSTHVLDQQEQIQDLQIRATRNPVSNLYNKAGFQDKLAEVRAAHPNTPIAVIEIDLGRFKTVNDTLGHQAGNVVLQTVGSAFRRSDGEFLVGHPGGDEFRIAAPLTNRTTVLPLSAEHAPELSNEERLQIMVRRTKLVGDVLNATRPDLKALGFTISAGGAILEPGMELDEVIALADSNMYRDKQAGNEAAFKALPLRKRLAHHIGNRLLRAAGTASNR